MTKTLKIKGTRYEAWKMESISALKKEYKTFAELVFWLNNGKAIFTDKGNKIKAFYSEEEDLTYYAMWED